MNLMFSQKSNFVKNVYEILNVGHRNWTHECKTKSRWGSSRANLIYCFCRYYAASNTARANFGQQMPTALVWANPWQETHTFFAASPCECVLCTIMCVLPITLSPPFKNFDILNTCVHRARHADIQKSILSSVAGFCVVIC